jgi:hypothetical protein
MNKRVVAATLLLLVSGLIWLPGSPVIQLIITNEEIVLGRYSRGHFGILLLLTLILWTAASVIFFTRRKPWQKRSLRC